LPLRWPGIRKASWWWSMSTTEPPIDFFDGTEFDFLSNFHPSPFIWRGKRWNTVEHAYQAMKSHDPNFQEYVRMSRTPGTAKYRGRMCKSLRPDWNKVKFALMAELVELKFSSNDHLAERLLATGERELIEGNTWGDRVWGKTRNKKTGELVGDNWLGVILMEVRKALQIKNEKVANG
jgi:ribA/ribD-fused uncharacterized protein